MKKALVIALMFVLGLGMLAFAGPLTGSWSTTVRVDPGATDFDFFFLGLDSTLVADYTFGGWTFGSKTVFDKAGFASQSFSAAGVLGAFTFSSNMSFDPMAITVKTYDVGDLTMTQTPSTICPLVWTTTTSAPKFLKWDATGSVSIAGVSLEGYFLLDQSHYDVTLVDYLTDLAGEQTSAYTCTSYNNGAGWRFKIAGGFGDTTITSYTYFNMLEKDASAVTGVLCPVVGKAGVYYIQGGVCTPGFTEEYIALEGFSFGCVTLDVGLSILCTGFSDITFVLNDIGICGWLDLDFGIIFTTDSKTVDLCMSMVCDGVKNLDCVTVEMGFGSPTYVTSYIIDKVYLHGVGFTYTFNGISFSSYTELDVYSSLFSTATAWTYVNGDTQNTYMVPYAGRSDACTTTATYFTIADEWYEAKCVVAERFKLWEKFVIDVDSDACCGGLLDITVGTFFGDHQVLDYYGYATYLKAIAYAAGATPVSLVTLYGTLPALTDTTVYTAVTATTYAKAEGVKILSAYKAGATTTLFDWAKTEVDLSVGVGSNVTLTLGFDISAFGWEDLEFGFKFAF